MKLSMGCPESSLLSPRRADVASRAKRDARVYVFAEFERSAGYVAKRNLYPMLASESSVSSLRSHISFVKDGEMLNAKNAPGCWLRTLSENAFALLLSAFGNSHHTMSAPASRYAIPRRTASSMSPPILESIVAPAAENASVRAMMIQCPLKWFRISDAARSLPANSSIGMTSLPAMCPHRFG